MAIGPSNELIVKIAAGVSAVGAIANDCRRATLVQRQARKAFMSVTRRSTTSRSPKKSTTTRGNGAHVAKSKTNIPSRCARMRSPWPTSTRTMTSSRLGVVGCERCDFILKSHARDSLLKRLDARVSRRKMVVGVRRGVGVVRIAVRLAAGVVLLAGVAEAALVAHRANAPSFVCR
jgi:hypothetical protein